MIRSVLGSATRRFVEQGKSSFSGMDVAIANRRLAQLSAATSLESLGRLNSIRLHKMKGDRRGFWSIAINGRWRLLFRFKDGDAYEVHIDDPHQG
jgi:proteic killer suppression protein